MIKLHIVQSLDTVFFIKLQFSLTWETKLCTQTHARLLEKLQLSNTSEIMQVLFPVKFLLMFVDVICWLRLYFIKNLKHISAKYLLKFNIVFSSSGMYVARLGLLAFTVKGKLHCSLWQCKKSNSVKCTIHVLDILEFLLYNPIKILTFVCLSWVCVTRKQTAVKALLHYNVKFYSPLSLLLHIMVSC